jgi:hypothetical protein
MMVMLYLLSDRESAYFQVNRVVLSNILEPSVTKSDVAIVACFIFNSWSTHYVLFSSFSFSCLNTTTIVDHEKRTTARGPPASVHTSAIAASTSSDTPHARGESVFCVCVRSLSLSLYPIFLTLFFFFSLSFHPITLFPVTS